MCKVRKSKILLCVFSLCVFYVVFINKNGNFQAFFTGSMFFVHCPLFSFNINFVSNELKECEEFSLLSAVYCHIVLQQSYICHLCVSFSIR